MSRLILLPLLLFFAHPMMAQVSVGYFPFQSEITMSSHSERLLWADLRIASNTFFGNVTSEPIMMINVKRSEKANLYAGAGLNFNFVNAVSDISVFNGYTFSFGTRAKPLKELNNLHFIFEISPYFNPNFDGGLLRSRLGLAYQFGKKRDF